MVDLSNIEKMMPVFNAEDDCVRITIPRIPEYQGRPLRISFGIHDMGETDGLTYYGFVIEEDEELLEQEESIRPWSIGERE